MSVLDVCTNSGILSTILLVKRLLEIICLLVPIILILMSAIEVSRIVMNPDAKVVKSSVSKLTHKVIAAVGVFFVPSLVSLLLSMLGTTNFANTSCWTNANSSQIASYREAEQVQKEAEQEKIDAAKKTAEDQRKIIEAQREALRAENEKKAAEAAKNASSNSTGTASELAAKMIALAQSEYDNRKSYKFPYRYTEKLWPIGGTYNYAWCAAFVAVMSRESGVYKQEVSTIATGVLSYIGYFKSKKDGVRYELSAGYGGTYVPKMGDYIFFDWDHNKNDGDHIGLVKGISGDKVLIIDGNCSNTICDRSKYLNDKDIIGYGVWE